MANELTGSTVRVNATFPLRSASALALFCAALPALAAQAYPSRPIRMVVPYTPGGNTDVLARLLAQRLAHVWVQQVVVDNRPGGNTVIGTEIVARAPADGHTIMLTTLTFAVLPSLYRKLSFDPQKDFAPITLAVTLPNVLVVHPGVAARSLPELIDLAKASPGKLSYASTGSGTSPHLSMELLKSMAGIDLVHVPYKGGAPAMTDLIAGQVAAQFIGLPVALPHLRSQRLRALAATGVKRSSVALDIPLVAETLPGYALDPWFGLFAPRGVSAAVATSLQREAASILRAADMRDHLTSLGAEAVGSAPQELAKHLRAEVERYAQIVKLAGLKVE